MFTLLGIYAGMFVILISLSKFYLRSNDLDITADTGCATFTGTFACPYLFMSLPVTLMLAIVCLGQDYKYK